MSTFCPRLSSRHHVFLTSVPALLLTSPLMTISICRNNSFKLPSYYMYLVFSCTIDHLPVISTHFLFFCHRQVPLPLLTYAFHLQRFLFITRPCQSQEPPPNVVISQHILFFIFQISIISVISTTHPRMRTY